MSRPRLLSAGWWLLVGSIVMCLALTLALKRTYVDADLLLLAWFCYGPVGAVVAKRRPENPIGWVFLLVGLLACLMTLSDAGTRAALAAGPPAQWWGSLSAWAFGVVSAPLFMLATTFTFLLYPSGLPSPRWRPVLRLAVAFTLTSMAAGIFDSTVWIGDPSADANAFAVPGLIPLLPESRSIEGYVWLVSALIVVFLIGAGGVSALLRARRSNGVERQQMRLFAFAILMLLVLLVPAYWLQDNGFSLLRYIVVAAGFACIPIACGVAIMRYRLYDIDQIMGRTTAYVLVTGVLLALYAAVVTTATALLPDSGDAAVAAGTLTAAAAFRPVLRWARRLVDRRFNRERYDAERAAEQFAGRLRGAVDGDEVVDELLGVLDRTVQPRAAGLWLREPS